MSSHSACTSLLSHSVCNPMVFLASCCELGGLTTNTYYVTTKSEPLQPFLSCKEPLALRQVAARAAGPSGALVRLTAAASDLSDARQPRRFARFHIRSGEVTAAWCLLQNPEHSSFCCTPCVVWMGCILADASCSLSRSHILLVWRSQKIACYFIMPKTCATASKLHIQLFNLSLVLVSNTCQHLGLDAPMLRP